MLEYLVFSLTMVGIYAILTLGLNVQWGFTGLFNIGVAAFFMLGAYASAIVTSAAHPDHLGGFELPIAAGFVAAIAVSAILALLVGLVTLNLRADYLAIASIGIAEIVRLVLKTEVWLTGGPRGMETPSVFPSLRGFEEDLAFLGLVAALVLAVYVLIEIARRAPWGRVLRGIRENEPAAMAAGKNVVAFRLQAFVLGACAMGLGGALYAHFFGFISPEAFRPMLATFLVWVMLIAGGSGSNKGAVLGAAVIWAVWVGTEFVTGLLPPELTTRAGALRVLLIGVVLEVILVTRPEGILSEASERRRAIRREARRDPAADAGASSGRVQESVRHGPPA